MSSLYNSVLNIKSALFQGFADIFLIGEFVGLNYLSTFVMNIANNSVPAGAMRMLALNAISAAADISKLTLFAALGSK